MRCVESRLLNAIRTRCYSGPKSLATTIVSGRSKHQADTSPTPIRILILYVTAGAGHRRAAEAIAQALRIHLPTAEVQCRDLLDDVPFGWRRSYPWSYYFLVRHLPRVWGTAFELLDRRGVYAFVQPLRRAWNLVMARRLIRKLREAAPDLVVATHFFPADVISACKRAGWLKTPLLVTITDLHPHRFWLSPEAEAYVCATRETASEAQQRGIRADRLHVLGIPIARAFHERFDRAGLQERFQLDVERRTVLVTSGARAVGPFEAVVIALMDLETVLPKRIQLLVVCGESTAVMRRLQQRARACAMPVQVLGFIDMVPEAMAVSDVLVAKAGGMTVTEALGRGLPLILYHAIPGQERWNTQYLTQHGAAMFARTPADVAAAVRRFMERPESFAPMREAASRLSHPEAADAIVSRVILPLLRGTIDA